MENLEQVKEGAKCESVWQRLFVAAGFVMLSASSVFAGSPKIARELQRRVPSDRVDVIVQFTKTPTARHHKKVFSKGGTLNRELTLVKAGSYSVPASELAALAADPEVAYISPERPVFSTNNGSPTAVLDYHTDTINAPAAWAQGLNGTGIGVAVIDSGIIDIPDLHGQSNLVVFSQNFVGGTSGSANDQYGHGSHVAGIIAGTGKNSQGSNYFYTFKGIADNVNVINLRVLDQNGAGTDSQVIAAIQMAIQLKSKYNIRVINLSLGRPVYESYTLDPLCQAVEQAWHAGIVVVVAAGNDGRNNNAKTNGYGTITSPGNDRLRMMSGSLSAAMEQGCWCELQGAYFANWKASKMVVPYGEVSALWWDAHFISLAHAARTLKRADPLESSMTPPVPTLRELLTPRQFEVVAFLSQGLTDKEIAERIGIGYRTIGCHVTEAMLKANVTKRTMLGRCLGQSAVQEEEAVIGEGERSNSNELEAVVGRTRITRHSTRWVL